MTQRYDLIVFDWDGTIMDSTGLIAACIRESAESVGLPVPDVESAKSVIGLGVGESIRRLFADIDEAQLSAFAAHCRARFLAQDHQLPLYDGIAALLGQLEDDALRERITARFVDLHGQLRRGCAARAAQVIGDLAGWRGVR